MKTYAVKKIALSFNGIPLSGFMKGSFLKISHTSDAFAPEIGSDGEVARVASADESGTIVVTLQQTSDSNDVLAAALALDKLSHTGTGVVMVKDTGGRTLCNGNEAWIRKSAEVEFSDGSSGREWTIDAGILKVFVGGN